MKKETHSVCRQTGMFYYDFITRAEEVPSEIRDHIKTCRQCREEISRLQEELDRRSEESLFMSTELLRLQGRLFGRWAGCSHIRPFLAVYSSAGRSLKAPTPVAAHLAHCPACRRDFESLYLLGLSTSQTASAGRYLAGDDAAGSQLEPKAISLLREIRHRGNSGVLTRIARDEKTGGFRVSVGSDPAVSGVTGSRASAGRPLHWFRHGLAAAAVLVIAVLMLWKTPTVRGLNIAEVYRALDHVSNVAIASYGAASGRNVAIASYGFEETEPIQQIWVSNVLDIHLYIEKDRVVLWDLTRRQKIIKTSSGWERIPIGVSVKALEIPWGLLPFRSFSELPTEYRWRDVDEPGLPLEPNSMVYDLTWTETAQSTKAIERRWRGYLNAYTKRPYRIEWWDKLPGEDFILTTIMLIHYPENEEILERIRAEGFDYSPGDQI